MSVVIRPPDIVVGRLRFSAILSFFLSFFHHLPSELAERNSTKAGHMLATLLGRECNLKMHVRNLPRKNPGPKKNNIFWQFPNLHQWQVLRPISSQRNMIYIIGQVCWKLQGVSYIFLKYHELWSTNGLKLDMHFYPRSVNSAFYFIGSKRRYLAARPAQPVGSSRMTGRQGRPIRASGTSGRGRHRPEPAGMNGVVPRNQWWTRVGIKTRAESRLV